jgi:hypothetical protein
VTNGQQWQRMGITIDPNFFYWWPRPVGFGHGGCQRAPGRVLFVETNVDLTAMNCEGFLYLVKHPCVGTGNTASISTGLSPRSGSHVTSRWRVGNCSWRSPGLGWSGDWTPLRCSIRWAARSGTGRDRAGPGRHRWCSRCTVDSPAGPLTPLTGPFGLSIDSGSV